MNDESINPNENNQNELGDSEEHMNLNNNNQEEYTKHDLLHVKRSRQRENSVDSSYSNDFYKEKPNLNDISIDENDNDQNNDNHLLDVVQGLVGESVSYRFNNKIQKEF